MDIVVIGAGAIGGWLGVRLAVAGHRVDLRGRHGSLAAMSLADGDELVTARFSRLDGPVDLVLVTTKATALADAAESLAPLLGPDTLVLPLQNGVPIWFIDARLDSLDPNGRIAAAIPSAQTIGAVVHAAVRRAAPDRVELVKVDHLLIGDPAGGESARVAMLADLFNAADIPTRADPAIRRAAWYKAWGNMTMNPISALTRATADRILADPGVRAFTLDCMAEAKAIGAAYDCPISDSGEDRLAVTARLGAFKTSMLQDAEAGRRLEVEALVGAPRELARRAGIATPALDRLYGLARLLDDSLAT